MKRDFLFAAIALVGAAACSSSTTYVHSQDPADAGSDVDGSSEVGPDEDASAPDARSKEDAAKTDAPSGACVNACAGAMVCQSTISNDSQDRTFKREGDACLSSADSSSGTHSVLTLSCGGSAVFSSGGQTWPGTWTETASGLKVCLDFGSGPTNCMLCR